MAKRVIKKRDKVLDLGCGSGVIGCYLYKKKIIDHIYGSDISKEAVNCAIYNSKKLTQRYDIRLSNSFSSWKDEKFDLIINDISGISPQINKISKWFEFAPNNSGNDGTKFTLNILKDFKNKTFNNASLIFPVLGLSNRDKIINFLKQNKINYKILLKKEWLTKDLVKHLNILKKLKRKIKSIITKIFNIIYHDRNFYLNKINE